MNRIVLTMSQVDAGSLESPVVGYLTEFPLLHYSILDGIIDHDDTDCVQT
jgi:hypothetical protein